MTAVVPPGFRAIAAFKDNGWQRHPTVVVAVERCAASRRLTEKAGNVSEHDLSDALEDAPEECLRKTRFTHVEIPGATSGLSRLDPEAS